MDLIEHLGLMAAQCELEAAMQPSLTWYKAQLMDLERRYRLAQRQVLIAEHEIEMTRYGGSSPAYREARR